MKPGREMKVGDLVVHSSQPYRALPREVIAVGQKYFLSIPCYNPKTEQTREINRFYVLEDGE